MPTASKRLTPRVPRVPQERVTMRSIAREAGVSHTTVSLVMNDRASEVGIHPDTQKRVRDIAERLKYQRNPMAQALRGSRTKTIGVLWSLGGPHDSEGMIRLIALDAHRHGYISYLTDHLADPDITRRALIDFRQRGVDAVVIQATALLANDAEIICVCQDFAAAVMVTADPATLPIDQVVLDRYSAIIQVAAHFARTGRRRVAFLAGNSNETKFAALAEQCRNSNLDATSIKANCNSGPLRDEQWIKPLRAAFENQPADQIPDALLASSDEVAMIAMQYFQSRGLRVPEDVALVGFNNSFMARGTSPPMASINRRNEHLAKRIEHLLYTRLNDASLPPRTETIHMQFVWRESAAGITPENTPERNQT